MAPDDRARASRRALELSFQPATPKGPENGSDLHRDEEERGETDEVLPRQDGDADGPDDDLHANERFLVELQHRPPRLFRAKRTPLDRDAMSGDYPFECFCNVSCAFLDNESRRFVDVDLAS